jgi:hypothetical protein
MISTDKRSSDATPGSGVTHPISPSEFLHRIMRQFYMNYFLEKEKGKMKTHEETTVGAQVLKKMEMMKQDALADEFNKHVSKKSYLIVLNDLSTIEDWDWIKTYFPNNKKGSRIIVSTEQAEVASLCAGPDKLVVELKQSSASQTVYAFCEKVRDIQNYDIYLLFSLFNLHRFTYD